jgi:hypothetical protein
MDTFACVDVTPTANANARVSFDGNFVPVEVSGLTAAAPTWFVDNTRGVHNAGTGEESQAALRASALRAGESATATIDCGAHRYLSFQLKQLVDLPTSDLWLDLQLNGALISSFSRSFTWSRFTIDSGAATAHAYTFIARVAVDVGPAFLVDTIACLDQPPL